MQRRKKRTYSAEFKAGAVRLVLEEGRSMNSVAKELDVASSVVTQWVHQAQADAGKGSKNRLTTDEKQELAELRKRVRQLEMEKEILKKAAPATPGARGWGGEAAAEAAHLPRVREVADGAEDRPRHIDTSEHHTYTAEEPNSLTVEELGRFLVATRSLYPQHFGFVALGFATGLRPSSLRALRRKGATPDVRLGGSHARASLAHPQDGHGDDQDGSSAEHRTPG